MGKLDDVVKRNRGARKRDVRKAAYALGIFGLIILIIALYECTTVFEPNIPATAKPAPAHRLDGVQLGAPKH